jgi:hypothetical protein
MSKRKEESVISLGYYGPKFKNDSHQLINELKAYEIIRGENLGKTQEIQAKHKLGIIEGFKSINKSAYQKDKSDTFSSVTFSITSPRAKDSLIEHTGIFCLDLDENTQEELNAFRERISAGDIPYARACALSVSGAFNGSMWLNVKCDIKEVTYNNAPALFKLLGLTEQSDTNEIYLKLHIAYSELLKYELSKYDINVPVSSKTLKQPRYLSNDKDIYVNIGAKVFTLDELLSFQSKHQERKKVITQKKRKERVLTGKKARTGFDLCERYAQEKVKEEETCEDAFEHKRRYCFFFGLKAIRLGISKEDLVNHIESVFIERNSTLTSGYREQLLSAYDTYSKSFGKDKQELYNLSTERQEQVLTLAKNERLNNKAQELDELLQRYKKLEVIANTGIGKNYAAINGIRESFVARTGGKVVLVCSLNAKIKKDYIQYGDKSITYVTGERLNKENPFTIWKEVEECNIILCNQNQYESVVRYIHFELNLPILSIIDEIQTLAQAYKEKVSSQMYNALNKYSLEQIIMTGTPLDYFNSLGYKRVRVQSYHSPINLEVRGSSKKWVLDLLNLIREYDKELLLIKYNSKRKLEQAQEFLIKKGIKPEQILVIHSDNTKEVRDRYEHRLNSDKKNSFAPEVKVVLCTSAINEGIDIYSEREIISVNFERTGFINPHQLVQFSDRWRTNKDKKVICFFPNLLQAPRGFNRFSPAYHFDNGCRILNKLVERFNEDYNNDPYYSNSEKIDFTNHFSNESKHIKYDEREGIFKLDYISVMVQVQEEYIKKCTALEGLEYITQEYDYFNVSFSGDSTEINKQELDEIEEYEKEIKLSNEQAQAKYLKLFQEDKRKLLQAIAHQVDSPEYNKFKAPAIEQERVQDFIKANSDILEKHLSIGKGILKRELNLDYWNFEDNEKEELTIGEGKFIGDTKFSALMLGVVKHLELIALDCHESKPEDKLMNKGQHNDAKRSYLFSNLFNAGEEYTQGQFYERTKKHFNKNGKRSTYSKAYCIELVRAFYHLKEKRTKKGIVYEVIGKKEMVTYLREKGIKNPEKILLRFVGKLSSFSQNKM